MLHWIPLLPFAGFVDQHVRRPRSCRRSSWAPSRLLAMLGAFAVSALAVNALLSLPPETRDISQTVFTWIGSADFQVPLGLRLDPLSALMILVVTGIGFLIHLYSTAYMIDETPSEYARYFVVPQPVRRFHAAARPRRQLHCDVRRVGRRRAVLVSADRVLVPEALGRRRGQEGLYRQSHRRCGLHSSAC